MLINMKLTRRWIKQKDGIQKRITKLEHARNDIE